MKKAWLVLYTIVLCFFYTTIYTSPLLNANETTRLISRRFYLINRLSKIVTIVFENQQITTSLCYQKLSFDSFTHPIICKAAQAVQKEKSIAPLIKLWKAFSAYRFMQDKTFEAEFMRMIFLVCYDISSEQCKSLQEKYNIVHLCDTASIDDVTLNFYTIRRLGRVIAFLENVNTHEKHLAELDIDTSKKNLPDKELQFLEENCSFSHTRIQECIIKMYDSKNLQPLLHLCNEYTQYRYASDHLFLKEQLTLIFFAYKNMLTKKLSDQSEQVIMYEMDFIQEVCDHIEDLNIDQILDVIDIVTNRLITIRTIEEETKSSGLTAMIYSAFQSVGSFLMS